VTAPIKLFVKGGCPWCDMAEEWLQSKGFRYELVDVIDDHEAFQEMIRLSGQRRAPTMEVGGEVLADFGPDDLERFVREHALTP
jgi:glutaredoxin 3